MKRFSDFAKSSNIMVGDKIKIDDITGKEIQILGYRVTESKQKIGTECLTLQIKINDEKRVVFTSSTILLDQIKTYEDEIPFAATIEKVNNYYTFS